MNVDCGFPIYVEDAAFGESAEPDGHVVEFLSELNKPLFDLLGFSTANDVNIFFRSQDFTLTDGISTFYGDLEACQFSSTRLSLLFSQKQSLALLAAHSVTFVSQRSGLVNALQSYPQALSQVVRANFFVYWFYMVCRRYLSKPIRRQSLSVVRRFLADLRVFESLHDDMRQEQLFIYSWMQHKEPLASREHIEAQPTCHHEISDRLIFNLKKRLQQPVDCLTTCARNVKLANKISRFLYDSSEYPNALEAVRTAYSLVDSFSRDHPDLKSQCLQLEYEVVCLMLQNVDAHSLYDDPASKDLIYNVAPQLFLRINYAGLSATDNPEAERLLLNTAPNSDDAMAVHHGFQNLKFSLETFQRVYPGITSTSTSPMERQETPLTQIEASVNVANGEEVVVEEEEEEVELLPAVKMQRLADNKEGSISLAYGLCLLGHVYYSHCRYGLAFHFAEAALTQLLHHRHHPPVVVVQTLLLIFRITLLQRSFALATRLIEWGLLFCRRRLGIHHTTYPRLLIEYATLIHSVDKNRKASEVYRYAVAVVKSVLPGLSLLLALALENLGYTHYVLDYTAGRFNQALRYASAAIEVIARLGYRGCIQKASAIRVRALINEEIAINSPIWNFRSTQLAECLRNHAYALDITEKTFGVLHLHTAKHFGNLGRLFQTLELTKASEEMHLVAIELKEVLVGPMDFEVGLSLGHLASLYAYHMDAYDKAEVLYLRSIDIGLRLFGATYSGLQYDYRGLQRVYRRTSNEAKHMEVTDRLENWRQRRLHSTIPDFLRHLSTDPQAHYRPAPPTPTTLEELARLFHDTFAEKFRSWSLPRMPQAQDSAASDDGECNFSKQ